MPSTEKLRVFNAIKSAPLKNGMHVISYSAISKKVKVAYTMVSGQIRILIAEKYIAKTNHYDENGAFLTNGYKILKEIE